MISLETNRLLLRDYKETDLNDMHCLWSDKETMYYLDDILCNSIEDTEKYLMNSLKNSDGHYFCICDIKTGKFMSGIGYTIVETTPLGKIVHLGYMLLPEFQKHGYMSEAAKKVIEFAFTKDNCIRINTGCHKENDASRKVLEKSGFRKEGERIKAVYHDGVMKDRLEYAINKDDFVNNID